MKLQFPSRWRRDWKKALILPIVFLIGAAGCGRGEWPYVVEIGGERVNVEPAITAAQRERGLMYRTKLDDGWGMLFVYPKEKTLRFWMKDTRIPLSIAFIDNGLVIRDVQDMQPMTLDTHLSSVPARYALEVNQEWFRRHGIAPGERATFSPGLAEYLRTHPAEDDPYVE